MAMIDFYNKIFTDVATVVRSEHVDVTLSGEYTRRPSKFPMVTLDEIENVTVASLVDSSNEERYSGLSYRLQVFSNKTGGKKAEARDIFATADKVMLGLGFRRITYSTTPEIYDSTIYSIVATYEAIVDVNGVIYSR
jgi:hypothetical protein